MINLRECTVIIKIIIIIIIIIILFSVIGQIHSLFNCKFST
jgi:hypothetical protein